VAQKRILFLIGNYGTGGKERQLTEIIKRLSTDKYETHLFMKNDVSYYFNSIKSHLTSYHCLDKSNFNVLDIMILSRYLKVVRPDIVFSFSTTLSHFSLFITLLGQINYRLINGSIRDAPVKHSIDHKLERVLYHLYREVVANSIAGLRAFNQLRRHGRHVLYNGFDMDRVPSVSKQVLRKQLNLPDQFIVVMAARMDSDKDQRSFILGAYEALLIDSDIVFLLLGDGEKKREYELMVQTLGIQDKVLFIGETQKVESYLLGADVSALLSAPHHGEGIANAIIESLACGTPVIATDNGGTSEVIIHDENGFLIPNGDFKAFSEKIILLKDDVDMARKFSKSGLRLINEKFNQTRMIQSFENILES
tara:strand:+ start:48179 stop:49273 length:1095 start_codon:yes stop_codon:yes gene_type:complete